MYGTGSCYICKYPASHRYYRHADEDRNADVWINACKDIGLAVNKGKTKYLEVARHRSMMENEKITEDSNSYERVKIFKHLDS
jgi:hypothetical protein